jgi:anti-sigma28 factor (negative regulator of flagellin synthesis)
MRLTGKEEAAGMRVDGKGENRANARMGNAKSGGAEETAHRGTGATEAAGGPAESSDGVQLSKLSSVLNGLESGASAIRRHVQQAMTAVRTGSYRVDPLQLSKRIVGEALGSA